MAEGRSYREDSERIKKRGGRSERVWPDFLQTMIVLAGGHERPVDKGEQLSTATD